MENGLEKVSSFGRLFAAEKRASRNKRDRREVAEFELELGTNICALSDRLANGTYKIREYYKFTVHAPKEREIQALHFADRVVQNCLCNELLRPYFERRLVYDCAACRTGKGTHFAMRRLSDFMRAYYRAHGTSGYVLKIDIRHYFDSIDHEVLKRLLRKYPDAKVREFLYVIIDSYEKTPGKGLPMGNQTSQWFALYYLDRLDREIKERMRFKYYSRYMDDLVLIHEDKAYLKQCLDALRTIAREELRLDFNEKTQISPLSTGVTYLGFRFYLTETGKVIKRLRPNSKRRFKRRIKSLKQQYAEGRIDYDKLRSAIASYMGHLKHGNTYNLRKKIFSGLVFKREYKERKD